MQLSYQNVQPSAIYSSAVYCSVVDPHWLQCGSGVSLFHQCGFRSKKPNQCGYESWSDFAGTKSWIFTWKILYVGNASQNTYVVTRVFFKGWNQSYLKFWSGFTFPIRIWILESQVYADPDPQHWFMDDLRHNLLVFSSKFLHDCCRAFPTDPSHHDQTLMWCFDVSRLSSTKT